MWLLEKLVVRRSICGIPLHLGSAIIAIAFLLANAYDLLMAFDNLRYFNRNVDEMHKEHPDIDEKILRSMLWKSIIVTFAFCTIRSASNSLLFYGILKKNEKFMLPSLILQGLGCIGYLLLVVMLCIILGISGLLVDIIVFFLFGINLYCFSILYSYYLELYNAQSEQRNSQVSQSTLNVDTGSQSEANPLLNASSSPTATRPP